jgi:hypothetical protein
MEYHSFCPFVVIGSPTPSPASECVSPYLGPGGSHTRLRGRGWGSHIIRTEWQWPLSGVHSITMEKSAQPGEGGGARQPPFTISTGHHGQSCGVRSSWEGRYTPLISTLHLHVLCGGSNSDEGTDTVVLYVYCNPSTLPP